MEILTTCWEPGVSCGTCGAPVQLGQELLYGSCLSCARGKADLRDGDISDAGLIAAMREAVSKPGRITLTRKEIRRFVELAREADPSFDPVHKPDRRPVTGWYSRLAGWDASRVAAGLTAAEAAGMWLDFLAVGRTPPLQHGQISAILEVIARGGDAR